MRDFSLDLSAEAIHSSQTREYFGEVLKSYYSESYRSSIVMLYTISIADLIYKVRDLHDLYADTNAETIVEEVKRLQTSHPNSPEWESKLIEMVKDQTNLLEPADYLHLITLQKLRHLCAHPIITQNYELYSPNKETTRSHIRNMLEGLLIKPPLLSRKILNDLLAHLVSIKYLITDDSQLEVQLKSSYLDRLQGKPLKQVMRSLWKIVLKTRDQLSNDNRDINLKALLIIIKNNYEMVIEAIRDEKDYFSDIHMDNIDQLIVILNRYPKLFVELTNGLEIIVRNTIKINADLDMRAIFLSKDVDTHIAKMTSGANFANYTINYFAIQSVIDVFEISIADNKRDLAYSFLIDIFGKSGGYEMADARFSALIKPKLEEFTLQELIQIIEKVNTNSQISDRRRAKETNALIKAEVDKRNSSFDYTSYPNFAY